MTSTAYRQGTLYVQTIINYAGEEGLIQKSFLRVNIITCMLNIPRSRHFLGTRSGWTGLGTEASLGMGLQILHPVNM